MMALFAKINPGVIWLLIAIATDVLSTFYSAKGNGLVKKFMQAGILYVLWSGIGVIATALLAKTFLGQNIDLAGWLGIGFITVGLTIIAQFSNIDV